MKSTTQELIQESLSKAISYTEYRTLVAQLVKEGKSTGPEQTEDLSNVEFETSEDVEVIPTFDNMGLRDELLRGIYAYGIIKIFLLT